MSGSERRNQLVQFLSAQNKPVSGSALAKEFGVSRQVIVQDIALLRSSKVTILSTNRGYMVPGTDKLPARRTFKCRHTDDDAERELTSIVDQGGIVEDVFVNHKVYGEIRAAMHVRSRRDVNEFMEMIHSGKSTPLKNITSDYHYHTVAAESEDILNTIEAELDALGILVKRNVPGGVRKH